MCLVGVTNSTEEIGRSSIAAIAQRKKYQLEGLRLFDDATAICDLIYSIRSRNWILGPAEEASVEQLNVKLLYICLIT